MLDSDEEMHSTTSTYDMPPIDMLPAQYLIKKPPPYLKEVSKKREINSFDRTILLKSQIKEKCNA